MPRNGCLQESLVPGSGLNVPHYPPASPPVLAVDPAQAGQRLAALRIAASPVPAEFAGADEEPLAAAGTSIDHALVTGPPCTIPDPGHALAGICQAPRAGGLVHFVKHGQSPIHVARWPDRLTPLHRPLAGRGHLNRATGRLITESGPQLTTSDADNLDGPKRSAAHSRPGSQTSRHNP